MKQPPPSRSARFQAASPWQAATGHAFTEALAADTLPAEAFLQYMAQDYWFVGALADAVGHLIAKAPTFPAKRRLTQFLAAVLEGEDQFFGEVLMSPGAVPAEPLPATRALSDLLRGSAAADAYGVGLGTRLAGEWVCLDWGQRVAAHPPKNPAYRRWAELHAEPGFEQFVHWLQAELDGLDLSGPDELRARENFVQAVHDEVVFF